MNRRGKYGNKKTIVNGEVFDSRAEASRYQDLLLLEKAGKISNLKRQKEYLFELNGVKICKYRCDFTYNQGDALVVEDKKGFKTAVYKLKKKLMKAFFNIDILET